MKKELRFHPDIYYEVMNAYDWYESKSEGLGNDQADKLTVRFQTNREVTDGCKRAII